MGKASSSPRVVAVAAALEKSIRARLETTSTNPRAVAQKEIEHAAEFLHPATVAYWHSNKGDISLVMSGIKRVLHHCYKVPPPAQGAGGDATAPVTFQDKLRLAHESTFKIMSEPCPPDTAPATWQFQCKVRADAETKRIGSLVVSSDPYAALDVAVNQELEEYMMVSLTEGATWAEKCGDPLGKMNLFAFQFPTVVMHKWPLLQFAFWVIMPAPSAQTLCERTNSAARIIQGMWRNRLTRKRFERLVLVYKAGPPAPEVDEATAQAATLETEELVLNAAGELVEPDLHDDDE